MEIERKYDVDDLAALPDWTALPGVAVVGAAEIRELDAQYLDTADRSLARSGFALRRRSGGPDEGWHIKGPLVDGGRVEQHWPLGDARDASVVPPAILAALSPVTTEPLLPLARIRNARTAYALRAADGGLVAEFVDDRVRATDQRSGVERAWREWEFELGAAAPADPASLFAAADDAITAVGGRPAGSASKLARALGA
ncbi:CYTH domain-containing protein [Microbacterium deminutum]|uniref:CYTH domain-containing protein n=1 Tax=Microbacterium deminutum TaxID=344164 RepID=A0ABN2QB98_9MICO